MVTVGRVVFALIFALVVTGLLVWPIDWNSPKSPLETSAQADPSNPPESPDSAKSASSSGKPKVLTMSEAVVIAERLGKGQVLKAERKDRPEPTFKFEVLSREGQKVRLELAIDGTVKAGPDASEKKPPEKKPKGDR